MWKNHVKFALRNLSRNRGYSAINIGGLAVGMAVAMLIGLWIWDELSFDKYHRNYDRLAQVIQNVTNNGVVETWHNIPYPLAEELRTHYGGHFEQVVMGSGVYEHLLTVEDKVLNISGAFFEPTLPELLTLDVIKGDRDGLRDPASIMLSASTAKAFFGDADPIDQLMKIDNEMDVRVTGVYADLPANTTLAELHFLAPWLLLVNETEWIRSMEDPWRPNAFQLFVQLNEGADFASASFSIKDAKLKKVNAELAKKQPALFLHPMRDWHLYGEFENGVNIGGRIQYVWLFGIIGLFVLFMACINFMNLSTARSEKRAKEVGIRKAVGSRRGQLVGQFLGESLLITVCAFVLTLALVYLLLPFYNEVADKTLSIPWTSPAFYLSCLVFIALTGLIAGSYPAFYLSSFRAVTVLKGVFKAGRWAAVPRKALIVLQFTVSITLIIGTIIVFRQIQFAQDRPLGYNTNGLVASLMVTEDIHDHFDAVKDELLKTGAIIEMAESNSPPTQTWSSSSGFSWPGKDPDLSIDFPNIGVSHDYGKTIGWEFVAGRDFSRDFATDSSGFVLNEAAVRYMGLDDPIGTTMTWFDTPYKVIGVVRDMIMQSPFEKVGPAVFYLADYPGNFVLLKLNPELDARTALGSIETTFRRVNPAQPFDYEFVDEEYARKFGGEERIGKLAGFFTILAVFISCLGLFGLASFVAERRTREIGIRKVLGASVFHLWALLSKDFVVLVAISCLLAAPIAYYFLQGWLQRYDYHTDLSWWVFAASSAGALGITILTVSFKGVKAALANPVNSLRSE